MFIVKNRYTNKTELNWIEVNWAWLFKLSHNSAGAWATKYRLYWVSRASPVRRACTWNPHSASHMVRVMPSNISRYAIILECHHGKRERQLIGGGAGQEEDVIWLFMMAWSVACSSAILSNNSCYDCCCIRRALACNSKLFLQFDKVLDERTFILLLVPLAQ